MKAGFSQQNVYLNLAVTDALQVSTSQFTKLYGAMTDTQFIQAAYKDIYGSVISAGAQSTFLNGLQAYSSFVASVGYTGANTDLAAKAATAGVMLSDLTNNTYGAGVTAFYNAAANGQTTVTTPSGSTVNIYGANLRTL